MQSTPTTWLDVIETASITTVLGIAAFVLSQLIQRLVIEPIQEQRKIIAKVAHALTAYREIYVKGTAADDEAAIRTTASALASIAAELRTTLMLLPFYDLFASCRCVWKRTTIISVANELIRWQTYMTPAAASKSIESIKSHLKFCFIPDEDEHLFTSLTGKPAPRSAA